MWGGIGEVPTFPATIAAARLCELRNTFLLR